MLRANTKIIFPAVFLLERSGFGLNELLGLAAWPCNLNLAMLHDAISQVQIDQALVRNAGFHRHALEVDDNVFRKTHRYRLLQLRRVGIPARLHPGKIVLGFHGFSLP